jgi:hypothetical protein
MEQDPPRGSDAGADPADAGFSDAPTHMGVGPLPAAYQDERGEHTTDPAAAPTAGADTADTADPDAPGPDRPRHSFPGGLKRLADRYELEEPIASGGAAIVWRAFDDVLSRSVAIKLLHPHLATDPTTVERFRLESINAARLTHPNVVAIYDTGQERDVVYLVMEYVDGPSLRDLQRDRGPLEPSVVAALGEQVAKALGEAHGQGVVHRDVKPANILLTRDGVAKVTDFGIAKALSGNQATLTSPGTVVGTAAYVAPEQLEGGPVDGRADVYALGVVLHECLTGQPAFSGDTPTATAAARLTQELIPPRQVRADVPRNLDDVVTRATRRAVDDRYADGNALAAALAPLVHARPSDVTVMLLNGEPGGGVAPDDERDDDDTGPFSGNMPSTRAEYGRRLATAFLGGLVLAVIGFLATQAVRDEPRPGASFAREDVIPVRAAADFDPYGQGGEHSAAVGRSVDANLSTAWTTETYRESSRFGDLKSGVGIFYDLGQPRTVREVAVDLIRGGIDVSIYAADAVPDPIDRELGWGEPIATFTDVEFQASLPVPDDHRARYWLFWITDLAEAGQGTYQAGIAELRFIGSRE